MPRPARDYDAVMARLRPATDAEARMQTVADAVWDVLHATGVTWVGFYLDRPGEPDDRRLVLGPHRDGPACSPIGLHGVCGQALRAGACRIIDDTLSLGDAYVACDPRDRAEIVVPLVARGRVWAVLDLDAHEPGAFDARDECGLRRVLTASGLMTGAP